MELTYYGKGGASSLSTRRRNLMCARIAARVASLLRRPNGDLSVELRTALSKVWNFCFDIQELWLGDRPYFEYQLENQCCVSRTNSAVSTPLVVSPTM